MLDWFCTKVGKTGQDRSLHFWSCLGGLSYLRDMSKSPLHWQLTLLWGVLIAVVVAACSAPIVLNQVDFPFWFPHFAFIVLFLGATRYIFFLRHSWLARQQIVKVALVFLSFWAIFWLVSELHAFQVFADEIGVETLLTHLPAVDVPPLNRFILTEMVFFGVGAIIAMGVLVIRLIISVWRWHNLRRA